MKFIIVCKLYDSLNILFLNKVNDCDLKNIC